MAAIVRVDCVLVSPPGEYGSDKGYCNDDVEAGQPVVITSATPPNVLWEQVVEPATGTTANGIALKDCNEGGTVEYAFFGEVDGYTGLTPGAGLTFVDGEIDDTPPGAGVTRQMVAVTPSRIRFNLI